MKKSENKSAAAHQGGCLIRKLSCFPDITKGNYRNNRVSLIRSRTGGRSSRCADSEAPDPNMNRAKPVPYGAG